MANSHEEGEPAKRDDDDAVVSISPSRIDEPLAIGSSEGHNLGHPLEGSRVPAPTAEKCPPPPPNAGPSPLGPDASANDAPLPSTAPAAAYTVDHIKALVQTSSYVTSLVVGSTPYVRVTCSRRETFIVDMSACRYTLDHYPRLSCNFGLLGHRFVEAFIRNKRASDKVHIDELTSLAFVDEEAIRALPYGRGLPTTRRAADLPFGERVDEADDQDQMERLLFFHQLPQFFAVDPRDRTVGLAPPNVRLPMEQCPCPIALCEVYSLLAEQIWTVGEVARKLSPESAVELLEMGYQSLEQLADVHPALFAVADTATLASGAPVLGSMVTGADASEEAAMVSERLRATPSQAVPNASVILPPPQEGDNENTELLGSSSGDELLGDAMAARTDDSPTGGPPAQRGGTTYDDAASSPDGSGPPVAEEDDVEEQIVAAISCEDVAAGTIRVDGDSPSSDGGDGLDSETVDDTQAADCLPHATARKSVPPDALVGAAAGNASASSASSSASVLLMARARIMERRRTEWMSTEQRLAYEKDRRRMGARDATTAHRIKTLARKLHRERHAGSMYHDPDVLAQAIYDFLPKEREMNIFKLNTSLPEELKLCLPLKQLSYFRRYPKLFGVFEVGKENRFVVQRAELPPPSGTLKSDFTEAELLAIVARDLVKSGTSRSVTDLALKLPEGARLTFQRLGGMLPVLSRYPQYFSLASSCDGQHRLTHTMVDLVALPP